MFKHLKKNPRCLLLLMSALITASCSKGTLSTNKVAYQSVRTVTPKQEKIPDDAKIAVLYNINNAGELTAIVVNKTDEIMIIDQTMSFVVNSDGISTSYYDPTVRTTTKTDLSSSTGGASVNLGAIGGALGIGGSLGTALSGINLGGSETSGQAIANTTYFADQPRISLAPRSQGAMSKNFAIKGLGWKSLGNAETTYVSLSPKESFCRFSVCISYSLDGGNSFEKIVTDFYANSQIIKHTSSGLVNQALRNVFTTKQDALYEPWWMLYFSNNLPETSNVYDCKRQGILFDYQ